MDVLPNRTFSFLIIQNGIDTCLTQISTMLPTPAPPLTDTLTAEQLRSDFTLLKEALKNLHAGLYRYQTKEKFERLMDSCTALLAGPLTLMQFGKIVMQTISAIEDGHTGTNLPPLLMAYYNDHEIVFPFNPYLTAGKAYVPCDGIAELPVGTEIVSIDNLPISQIIHRLYAYLPSDGSITTKKKSVLNDGAFPLLYHVAFGSKNSFKVQYLDLQQQLQTVQVSAIPMKDIHCYLRKRSAGKQLLQLDRVAPEIALMTIKTFDEGRIKQAKLDYHQFLDSTFNVLNNQKTAGLIIDLRDNGGGVDEYGALLYSYLSKKSFRYFASIATTSVKIGRNANSLLRKIKGTPGAYMGRVYILTNGLSFSTTTDFCAIARSNKRAIFIGEETGGGYMGNTSGSIKEITLPASRFIVKIPLYKYENAVKKAANSDRGILPDYPLIPELQDRLQNKDVVLEMAQQLAAQ